MVKIKDARKGRCPVCGRDFLLLKDGRVGRHGSGDPKVWPPRDCLGWGQLAATKPAVSS